MRTSATIGRCKDGVATREPVGASGARVMKSAYEWTGREKAIESLRWLLVPCMAVLAGFVVPRLIMSFLIPPALAQPPGTPRVPPSDFQRFYLPWIANIVM